MILIYENMRLLLRFLSADTATYRLHRLVSQGLMFFDQMIKEFPKVKE
jgi:hypothetical protein